MIDLHGKITGSGESETVMMISEELKKAREYEEKMGALVTEEERAVFHFSPRIGWLNDPNGFSYYNGRYHLFYQYHPYSTYWAPMHWGHAVSSDLITWEYLPCAMAPDTDYDGAGCFSGSAITLPDGRQLLMYTGCSRVDIDDDGRWAQTQCLAVSTGAGENTDFIKFEGNPVISGADLPEGGDTYEFRDPYIWQVSDGSYRAVVANANVDGGKATQISMFRSPDGFDWEFDKVLFEDWRHLGIMWECPNFFPLDGRQIFIASPMDMEAEEADGSIRFPKGNNVCYMVGDYDEDTEEFTPHVAASHEKSGKDATATYHPVDCGLDFYAPQVMKTPDGRQVMIGWMQDPSMGNLHDEDQFRIFGQMTVPRELSLRNDRLIQWPVHELDRYRKGRPRLASISLDNEERSIEELSGRCLDIELTLYPADAGSYNAFSMKFAKKGGTYTELRYYPERSILSIDRSNSWQSEEITKRRSIRVRNRGGHIDLRILLDRWSAEIFINGGEQVMSATFYTPLDAQDITFSAEGTAGLDVTAYRFIP